jgi:hypothetical protein
MHRPRTTEASGLIAVLAACLGLACEGSNPDALGDTGPPASSCELPALAALTVLSAKTKGTDAFSANLALTTFDDATAAVVDDADASASVTQLELNHVKWFTPIADTNRRARALAISPYDTNDPATGEFSLGAVLITRDTVDIRETNASAVYYGTVADARFGRLASFEVDAELNPVAAVFTMHTAGASREGAVALLSGDDLADGVTAAGSDEDAGIVIRGTFAEQQLGVGALLTGAFFDDTLSRGGTDLLVRAVSMELTTEPDMVHYLFSAATLDTDGALVADDADAVLALVGSDVDSQRVIDLDGDGLMDLFLSGREVCIILGGTTLSGTYTDTADVCDGRVLRDGPSGPIDVIAPIGDEPGLLLMGDFDEDMEGWVVRVVSLSDVPLDGSSVVAADIQLASLIPSTLVDLSFPTRISAMRTDDGRTLVGIANDTWDGERGRVDILQVPTDATGEAFVIEDLAEWSFEGDLALARMGSDVRLWQEDGCARVGVVMYNNDGPLDDGNPSLLYAPQADLTVP